MTDPRDHYFLVHDAPDCMWSRHLVQWFTALGVHENARPLNAGERQMDCQANRGIVKALRSDAELFCFVESDIRPHVGITAGFWESEADVVGAIYPTEAEHAWDHAQRIHSGLWRTRRDVLEATGPPWFEWITNPARTRTEGCICLTFCQRVLDAGFTIEQAGHAQHMPRPTPPGLTPLPKREAVTV